MGRALRQTEAQITEHLQNFRRDPFQNELAKLLNNSPSPGSIQKFSNKSPDRWAQSIAIMAKIAGFHERLEVDVKFKPLSSLADSELRNMLQDLNKKLDRIEVNTESNRVIEQSTLIDNAELIESSSIDDIEHLDQSEVVIQSAHSDPIQDTDIITKTS